jgi:hypothetical protein
MRRRRRAAIPTGPVRVAAATVPVRVYRRTGKLPQCRRAAGGPGTSRGSQWASARREARRVIVTVAAPPSRLETVGQTVTEVTSPAEGSELRAPAGPGWAARAGNPPSRTVLRVGRGELN